MKQGSVLGGSCLVAGITIGAGMLALPVVTGGSGFWPSCLLFLIYWIASILAALMFLEVTLCFDKPVNFVTMAKKTLGPAGAAIAWTIYLLLLYCLTAAYLSGSSAFLPKTHLSSLIFLLLFGGIVALGTKAVDQVNRILVMGLVGFYVALVVIGLPQMEPDLLKIHDFSKLWMAIPVVVTSFGFHIIIPTLTTYLHKDVARIKKSIFLGSGIAFLFYGIFQAVILGALPPNILEEALLKRETATEALAHADHKELLNLVARAFAFCAITTSFLGVSLGLRDFLADGMGLQPKGKNRALLLLFTFGPPLFFVFLYPRAFIEALNFGGLFVALLLGIWPVLMVYRKRQLKLESRYRLGGGTFTLLTTLLLYLGVIFAGFFNT